MSDSWGYTKENGKIFAKIDLPRFKITIINVRAVNVKYNIGFLHCEILTLKAEICDIQDAVV
jgi:hypothetical protein